MPTGRKRRAGVESEKHDCRGDRKFEEVAGAISAEGAARRAPEPAIMLVWQPG